MIVGGMIFITAGDCVESRVWCVFVVLPFIANTMEYAKRKRILLQECYLHYHYYSQCASNDGFILKLCAEFNTHGSWT